MAKPKIDPDALRQFLEAGHTRAEAARHFGVSEPAIHQRLRKLKQLTSRVMALERAGEVVEEKQVSATARLERVQHVIDGELSWAVDQARREGADRAALADVILKLAGEVRQQLGLQLQITRTLIDLREFRDFRQTVIGVLSQESPATGQRLVASLKARHACGRASICCRRLMTRRDPVGVSRDLLGELIADLERAFPAEATPGRYEFLPRLEDLQAVVSPILFASKADQERIFADPQYQHLYAMVIRQLSRRTGDQPIASHTPSDLVIDPEP